MRVTRQEGRTLADSLFMRIDPLDLRKLCAGIGEEVMVDLQAESSDN